MPPDFEIWLDHQLTSMLAKRINDVFGCCAKSSFIFQSQGWSDWQIYKKAREHETLVLLLSKDGDFPTIIEQNDIPPKLIKINTGNIRNGPLWTLISPLLSEAVRILTTIGAEIVYIENQDAI